MTRLNEYVISHAYGLPQEHSAIGQSTVAASGFDVENGKWFIILNGTTQRQDIAKSVKSVIGKSKYFSTQGRVYEVTTDSKYKTEVVKSNPPGQVQTVVSGGVTSQRVRKNPVSVSDFRSEMHGMLVSDPRRDFKLIDAPTPFGGESFRDVLYSFVSYRGESYGWTKGNKIYHRRGSLIMPKLKVNRAVEGAKMFYHTHPSKDEPSLSSADDYQFYFDLAFAFGIKHFYTIMENRLDHFEITVKKSKEEDYLKMDEDKVLDDINSIIDASEAEITKKHKSDKNMEDEKFYAKMTKDTVTRLNRRFGDFATIKYKVHANPKIVRENPSDAGFRHNPPIRISHIHKASQLEELRDTTNNFEHYGANEYGHSQYVYWWVDHHFSSTNIHPQGRLYKLKELGLDDDNRRLLRAYMEEEVAPGYSKLDILLLLALYHDVGKKREKEQGIHHSIIASNMFQDEIGPELNLPKEVSDVCALLMLTDCGRKNVTMEAFKSQAGDYLGVAYALQIADMLAHHPFMFTSLASEAKQEGRIDKANVEQYKVMVAKELFSKIADFLQTRVKTNPPPVAKSIIYAGSYDSPIDGDIAEQYLEVKKKHNGQLFIPIEESDATVTLGLSSGSFRTTMSRAKGHFTEEDPFGADLAVSLYEKIGRVLSDFTPGLSFAEAPEPAVMVNPRHAKKIHVVAVAGPTVTGKQAVIEEVARMVDGVVIPTVTTRPKRKHEVNSTDRIFVSDSKFKEMIEQGEFVEWNKAKNGYMFGRRFSDFTKQVAVVDVNLRNVSKYQDAFPKTTSVFLDPDMTPAKLATKIRSEVAVAKEQAATKAKQIMKQVANAQHIPFDMVIKSQGDKPHATAKQISDDIEKQNPPELLPVYGCPVCDVKAMTHTDWYCKEHGEVKQNPPASHYLNEVDRHYIEYVKSNMRQVSPVVLNRIERNGKITDRYMAVFEFPVVEKQDRKVKKVGTIRALFYSRSGTGSESQGQEYAEALFNLTDYTFDRRAEDGTRRMTKYDVLAEAPFLHNIAWKKWGDARGRDFSPVMWLSMLGYQRDPSWYIKPKHSQFFNFLKRDEPRTTPPFPSRQNEEKFQHRWGHRSMFYAGVALSELIPEPASLWKGQFLPIEEINSFMRKHGAILRNDVKDNPKSREEWFMDWAKLINMKNKELEAFLNSPLGKKAGLSASEAKEQGINSGRVSGRAILRMRKKIGLGGPKDYVKGPTHASALFILAQKKWNDLDWEWCSRQVRFNKRFMGDWMGKRKGPLVRKGQPTRRLLALWVWGFDPWRYARKVEKRKTMPKCPKVPWIGMTEKRMYGVQSDEVKMNPPSKSIRLVDLISRLEMKELLWSITRRMEGKAGMPGKHIQGKMSMKEKHKRQKKQYAQFLKDQFGYTGSSPVNALEAIFATQLKKFKKDKLTLYRAILTVNDTEALAETWDKYGIFESWGSKKHNADIYSAGDDVVKLMNAGNQALIEGEIYFGDVNWRRTISNNLIFGKSEDEINPDPDTTIFVKKVSFYKLNDKARKKYADAVTGIGMNWKPWIDPSFKPVNVWEPKEHFPVYGPDFNDLYGPAKANPQDKLPWLPEPEVDPATIEPHLDWPRFTKPAWLPKSMIPKTAVFSPSHPTTIRGKRMVRPAFYYIPPADLNALMNSQKYLELQEADRQRKIAEAEALKKQLQEQGQTFLGDWKENPIPQFKFPRHSYIYYNNDTPKRFGDNVLIEKHDRFHVLRRLTDNDGNHLYQLNPDKAFNVKKNIKLGKKYVEANFIMAPDMESTMLPDYLANPPNIPFPIPEEYQEELERRLTEEMTSEGYRPLTVKDDFIPDAYEDSPSDFDYAQGEYQEFLEEIEKGDLDEAYAEYSDVEGHVAYYLWTNHRIEMPVYTHFHYQKTLSRVSTFRELFSYYGLVFDTKYLNEGSNYEKIFKVRKALDKAADDQGKSRTTDTDEEIAKKVAKALATTVKKNPPNSLGEDFEWMIDNAYENLTKKIQGEDPDYSGQMWWNEQKPWIREKYGMAPVEGARWLTPIYEEGFDPNSKQGEFIGDDATPMHFLNQLKRIPLQREPNALRILQVALNIGQGLAADAIEERYSIEDFIAYGNPRKITPSYVRTHSDTLFVFGDNDQRKGRGGQAVIRDEPNAIGLRTKKAPRTSASAYYVDAEYQENVSKMKSDLKEISRRSVDYDKVYFIPGIGEGLAKLKEKAPRTYAWMKKNMPSNNPRTPGGKKFPSKYLKGLTAFEKMIAEDEIDKGYKYDEDDPEAYKFWKSDIKATARGMKIGSSKHKNKYYKKYRKNIDKDYKPSGKTSTDKFINRIRKETGIKKAILRKIYDKGLAAWRVGHRPGVSQHQWAAGRVYAFAVGADSSTGKGKPDHKLAVEAGVR